MSWTSVLQNGVLNRGSSLVCEILVKDIAFKFPVMTTVKRLNECLSLSCFVKDLHGRENEKRDCSHLQLDHIRLVAFLGYLSQLSPLQIRLCISRLRIFFLLFLETHALWVFQGQRPYWLLTNTYQNAMAIVEISIKPWLLWYRYPSSD